MSLRRAKIDRIRVEAGLTRRNGENGLRLGLQAWGQNR